ncbi:MAG: hypothetical protein AAB407_00755 [Patescibacteria group bacterium]
MTEQDDLETRVQGLEERFESYEKGGCLENILGTLVLFLIVIFVFFLPALLLGPLTKYLSYPLFSKLGIEGERNLEDWNNYMVLAVFWGSILIVSGMAYLKKRRQKRIPNLLNDE